MYIHIKIVHSCNTKKPNHAPINIIQSIRIKTINIQQCRERRPGIPNSHFIPLYEQDPSVYIKYFYSPKMLPTQMLWFSSQLWMAGFSQLQKDRREDQLYALQFL